MKLECPYCWQHYEIAKSDINRELVCINCEQSFRVQDALIIDSHHRNGNYNKLLIGGLGLIIAILLIVSLLIISNTVKLAMYDRQNEIAIMKMVGATNGFIRFPFVVEGFLLGVIGAGAAFGLEWVMYDALVMKIQEVDSLQLFSFVPFVELLEPMLITFSAAGLFVGVLGSLMAIRKFLDV